MKEDTYRNLVFKSFQLMFAMELELTGERFRGKYTNYITQMLGLNIKGKKIKGGSHSTPLTFLKQRKRWGLRLKLNLLQVISILI